MNEDGIIEVFEYRGKNYRLHYTFDRLAMIEKSTGVPTTAILGGENSGLMTLVQLITYIAYALEDEHGNYISVAQGQQVAQNYITDSEYGFIPVNRSVYSALMDDCGFLFQNA